MTTPDVIHPKLATLLPERSSDAHKGSVGRVMVIAGSSLYLGAAIHTAMAALRSGAGMVYLFTLSSAVPYIQTHYPDLIVHPLPEKNGAIVEQGVTYLKAFLDDHPIDAIALGPGLGQHVHTIDFIQSTFWLIQEMGIKTVVDADGLNALSVSDFQTTAPMQCVLTPHIKEFHRLFPSILVDNRTLSSRQDAATQACVLSQQCIIFKGAPSVTTNGTSMVLNPYGNSGMATAGVGDILTGMVSSFIAQKVPLFDASVLGMCAHSLVGDSLFARKGNGLIASDFIHEIPNIIRQINSN